VLCLFFTWTRGFQNGRIVASEFGLHCCVGFACVIVTDLIVDSSRWVCNAGLLRLVLVLQPHYQVRRVCPFTRVGIYYDTFLVLISFSHAGSHWLGPGPPRTRYLLPMVWVSRFVWIEKPSELS